MLQVAFCYFCERFKIRSQNKKIRHLKWHYCHGELALHFQLLLFTLLVLLASVLASVKSAWLNFGQHRGPTYSYNNGSKNRENWWARFTISIANKHNTKGHRVIKTKALNKNWLATWHYDFYVYNIEFHERIKTLFPFGNICIRSWDI